MPTLRTTETEVADMKIRFKKKDLLLIVSALFLTVTAYTLAYFTGSDQVTNRFNGSYRPKADPRVEINVTEHFEPPSEKSDDPFLKEVRIGNLGNVDSYIRVRLEFSSSDVRDISQLSADDDKDNESAYVNASEFPFSELPEGWTYRAADGFYYYTEAVAPGDSTAALIKWVKTVFPDEGYEDTDEFDIYVYSEAVPAETASGSRMTYEEAWR
jgi:hypothetical protein